jgi:16S rRNA (cytosine967-C5)-methyltransferase
MRSPARRAAYHAVLAVDTGRQQLGAALVSARDGLTDSRDRALATDIAVGTQRWRARLDYQIDQLSRRHVATLDPEIAAILRISAYQLTFLTRVPPSAVVNDAVELTRQARKGSASTLVNAVLRKLATAPPPLPPLPWSAEGTAEWTAEALAHLSVTGAHPRWLVERWVRRWGFAATAAWVAFNNSTPPVTIWPAWAERTSEEPTAWPPGAPTAWVPGGWMPEDGQAATAMLREGKAYAQTEASAAVAAVTAAVARPPLLDACAAPGGKTLALTAQVDPGLLLLAADLRPARVLTLVGTLRRSAGRHVPVLQADASALPFAATLGTVLLDAPCSGLGTLRRDPDLKWRRAVEDLTTYARAQHAMLDAAMRAIRPGGAIVYATCSSEPEENEDLVSRVRQESGWPLVDLRQCELPGRVRDLITADGWLRTTPHQHGLESFFAAVLLRPAP